jgi:2-haloacid dehalogenase
MTRNCRFDTLLVDLDDTLIDFKSSEEKSLRYVFEKFYNSNSSFPDFYNQFKNINKELWKKYESKGVHAHENIRLKRFHQLSSLWGRPYLPEIPDDYERKLVEEICWYENTPEILKSLHNSGIKICIISNGFSRFQRNKMEKLGVMDYCDDFLISEETGKSKPSQGFFELAIEKCKSCHENTLVVGDSLSTDFQGAINTGLNFCWVNGKQKDLPSYYPEPLATISCFNDIDMILQC